MKGSKGFFQNVLFIGPNWAMGSFSHWLILGHMPISNLFKLRLKFLIGPG